MYIIHIFRNPRMGFEILVMKISSPKFIPRYRSDKKSALHTHSHAYRDICLNVTATKLSLWIKQT